MPFRCLDNDVAEPRWHLSDLINLVHIQTLVTQTLSDHLDANVIGPNGQSSHNFYDNFFQLSHHLLSRIDLDLNCGCPDPIQVLRVLGTYI